MPGALTQYAQKKLLDHLLGIAAYTMPTGTYLALFTSDPTETGSTAGEPVGNGYARVALTASMSATVLATGQAVNAVLLQFGPASGSWGAVAYFGVMDASTSGNMLLYGALTTAMNVASGDSPPVSEAGLVLQLD